MNSSTTPATNATTAAIKTTLKWLVTETPNEPPCWVKATAAVVALLATYGILAYEFTTEVWSLGVEGLYDLNDTLAEHWVSWWCPGTVKPAVVTAKPVPAPIPVVPVVTEVTTEVPAPALVIPTSTPVVAATEVAPVETVAAEIPVGVAVAGVTNEMIDILTLTAPTAPNRATRRRNRTSK